MKPGRVEEFLTLSGECPSSAAETSGGHYRLLSRSFTNRPRTSAPVTLKPPRRASFYQSTTPPVCQPRRLMQPRQETFRPIMTFEVKERLAERLKRDARKHCAKVSVPYSRRPPVGKRR